MSATEQMRAMLDGLMGTARDGSDSQRQHLHFTDSRVCRAFLLDCCPHDIFASTKLELGECQKVHDPALRADYILANKSEDYFYEVNALERLQAFVNDADKKTDYLKRKLAETQEELTAEETSKLDKVHELTEKLGKKLAQVDKAEADGDVETKQKLFDEAEKIKKERVAAEAEYKKVSRPASSHQQQNLRVCEICSAYLGINDNDSRLADHFGGKLHLGFITIREKLDDLKKIVAEKRGSSTRGARGGDRSSVRGRTLDREPRDRDDYEHDRVPTVSRDYDRDHDHSRSRDSYRYNNREYERDGRFRDRERDRARDSRYRERERERDRSRSSSRYYREDRDSRPRDRYRDDRGPERGLERAERSDRSDRFERHDSNKARDGPRGGAFERGDSKYQEREITYQRRLREWEKREDEKARKYSIRNSDEQVRKELEIQESRKLKEFLEDYKDDRDDVRFYRGSALARRLADRRKEIEQDELNRQKEKMELEILSRSCAVNNLSPKPLECANETETETTILEQTNGDNGNSSGQADPRLAIKTEPNSIDTDKSSLTLSSKASASAVAPASLPQLVATTTTTTTVPTITLGNTTTTSTTGHTKVSNSEDKRKQVEELIGRIPTDKDQLFARQLDWSLLDENLMEKRIRPWVTKKIAEYMGEKEVDLIDFVCSQLNAHTDGSKMLREVAIVLDDEAEKFVVHMWRLLIFELEAKKIGLRK